MGKLIDIDRYLQDQKRRKGLDLTHFSERWGVTSGLISLWRHGSKRIGIDKAPVVFRDLEEYNSSWTMSRYYKEWPEIRRRFLLRKKKLDSRLAATLKGEAAPCGRCGDLASQHADESGNEGPCRNCQLDCPEFEVWIRRGRKPVSGKKLTA